MNHEAAAQACTDALFEIDSAAREAGTDPDDRVKPKACGTLTTDEYLDAVLAVTQQLNQNARDDLQDQIDKAAETDQ